MTFARFCIICDLARDFLEEQDADQQVRMLARHLQPDLYHRSNCDVRQSVGMELNAELVVRYMLPMPARRI